MTNSINGKIDALLIKAVNQLLSWQFEFYMWWGFIGGAIFVLAWLLRRFSISAAIIPVGLIAIFTPVVLLLFLPALSLEFANTRYALPMSHAYWLVGGLLFPVGLSLLIARYGGEYWSNFLGGLTRPYSQERSRRTDIRNMNNELPQPKADAYNPRKYFSDGHMFIGLDQSGKQIHIPRAKWLKSHIQIMGTTGSGKGVAAGMLLSQSAREGEAVVIIDPKNDEYLPHVMLQAAAESGKEYIYIDLGADRAQWNPFKGKSAQECEELLTAGFGMAEKGTDADFYRVEDRRVARQFAAFATANQGSLPDQFKAFFSQHPELINDCKKLYADLEELAITPAAQATVGLDIPRQIQLGNIIYLRGSTRNPRILKLQRIFLLSCIQCLESRDREDARHAVIFMDEFKYVLSRPALEALATLRDKRAHVMLAHQSLGDLKDCGGDLNPDAVIGGVIENCAIRISYRVQDPETAKWLSEASGKILIDDESRVVERNAGLTEITHGQRVLRQAERPLIDTNQLFMLPERCAVLFGVGSARFVFTSPMQVQKNTRATSVFGEAKNDTSIHLSKELIDVD